MKIIEIESKLLYKIYKNYNLNQQNFEIKTNCHLRSEKYQNNKLNEYLATKSFFVDDFNLGFNKFILNKMN